MRVTYIKVRNKNKNNRIEFWINNFDYEDGNDYLAKLFNKEFNATVEEKIDYIFFSIIKIHIDNVEYELLWHEDIGNMIYSEQQDEETNSGLEEKLIKVLDVLNKKMGVNDTI